MKKQLLIGIVGLCMSAISAYANNVETLTPQECSIDNKLVYEPINVINIKFAGHIDIAEDARAIITCGEKTIATGVFTSEAYRKEGYAVIAFDNLILPKGCSYKLEISEGAIYLQNNPTIKTENLKFGFEVPEKITGAECSVKNGSVVMSEKLIYFEYKTETEPIGNPIMTLYREGVPVRTLEAHVGWDWNLGQAYVDFGNGMNFEDGVNFSLVLPEGSLTPRFRTDITNEEARVDFVGGYTEPTEPINYVWCSLFDNHNNDVLDEVSFFYDQAVMLSPNPKIQLLDTDKKLIMEVTPILIEENGQWIVSCNFEGVKVPENGCYIIIPEGTVISANGDVKVNATNSLGVNVTTGVGEVSTNDIEIKVSDRRLIIDNAPIGKIILVYSVDGKKVIDHLIFSKHLTLELPSKDIYIVSINGKAYKIATQ